MLTYLPKVVARESVGGRACCGQDRAGTPRAKAWGQIALPVLRRVRGLT